MMNEGARQNPAAEALSDLAQTIEAVIADKSYGPGRYKQAAAASRPRAAATFTADTLMADLSAARLATAAEPKPAKARRADSQAVAKPRSLIDQAFSFGALAVVLAALLALTPWGRDLFAPFARFLN